MSFPPAPRLVAENVAVRTSTRLRSDSEPSSQLVMSADAHGFGARLSARATPALATMLSIAPASRKLTELPAASASSTRATTPAPAPAMANSGSSHAAVRLK